MSLLSIIIKATLSNCDFFIASQKLKLHSAQIKTENCTNVGKVLALV
jgi:hypothetical protein